MRASIVGLLGLTLAVGGCDKRAGGASQATVTAGADANTPAPDEVAPGKGAGTAAPAHAVDRSHAGETAQSARFTAADGRQVTLADFKGKPVLVNLWATWCVPCVTEMPTLDRLAARAKGVQILAVSQDMDGPAKVAPYWTKAGFKALRPSLDPAMGLSLGYKANLPTTLLLDSAGKEVWRFSGARDWTTDESRALIAEAH